MDAYIYDAVRTPRGSIRKNGSLKNIKPALLFKILTSALDNRNNQIIPHAQDVILGCVTQIKDQGANIAKTATMYAQLPESLPAMTVNRLCTSGLDAVSIAASKVHSGFEDVILAGGLESVSNVPMFSDEGAWFTDSEISKTTKFVHMGISADLVASLENLSRAELDEFAARSHQLSAYAEQQNRFQHTLVPIIEKGTLLLDHDENIRAHTSIETLQQLEPCFEPFLTATQREIIQQQFPMMESIAHLHHVGNSPSLADGAGLIVVGNKLAEQKLQTKPIAKIVGTTSIATHPMLLLGGQTAAESLLKKCHLSIEQIDVIEFYEAYAATAVKAKKDWHAKEAQFNPNGGVIATGHALGATGAIMLCSLLEELEYKNGRYGLIAMCGGGGVGTAMIIERLVR